MAWRVVHSSRDGTTCSALRSEEDCVEIDPNGAVVPCADDPPPAEQQLDALRCALLHLSPLPGDSIPKDGENGANGSSTAQQSAVGAWRETLENRLLFFSAVFRSGTELLMELRHRHLVRRALSAPSSKTEVKPGPKRKRAPSPDTIRVEDAESRAAQRRPRVMKALSDPQNSASLYAALPLWMESLSTRDDAAVRQYLGLSDKCSVLRSIAAVGAIAWWHGMRAAQEIPQTVTAAAVLGTLVTRESVWVAGLLQALCREPYTHVAEQQREVHIEGIAQFLFPSESYHSLVNVFVSPVSPTLAHSAKNRISVLAQCCLVIAPFLCSGVWSGMDVPRGAKYYPAAHKLMKEWKEMVHTILRAKGGEYRDVEEETTDTAMRAGT